MRKSIVILGSTGSIGKQALRVARHLGLKIPALTGNNNIGLLEAQIREFRPALAAVPDEALARSLAVSVADCGVKVLSGIGGLCECAAMKEADLVLNGVVGMAGLRPTLAAVEAGTGVALANKETLVAAGDFVMEAAKQRNVPILPVDSEHSAIFQCLQAAPDGRGAAKIILTASGGPFFGYTKEMLETVKAADALRHPTWKMGAKISVDSASMMNKGLELIEAVRLFGVPAEQIGVLVHRESIVHSMVEFEDGSVLAQLGVPDMTLPIQYALTYPERLPSPAKRLDLAGIGKLTFFAPDDRNFPLVELCRRAAALAGLKPAAANGANEQAVELFLQGKIGFLRIAELVEEAVGAQPVCAPHTLADVFEADAAAREFVLSRA